MLELDVGRLEREGRVTVEGEVAPDDPIWAGTGLRLAGPLAVRASAQRAGSDVVVELAFEGELAVACGRCLTEVAVGLDGSDLVVFREGVARAEAEAAEVYAMPTRARSVDLGEPIREQVVLSVPAQVVCREACAGLCPRCGTDRNRGTCECRDGERDERWAPLKRVTFE